MAKIRYSVGLKVVAVFLFVISLAALVLSVVGVGVMAAEGVYMDGGASFRDTVWEDALYYRAVPEADYIVRSYRYAMDADETGAEAAETLKALVEEYNAENTNMILVISVEGEEIFRSGDGKGTIAKTEFEHNVHLEGRVKDCIRDFETLEELDEFIENYSDEWVDFDYVSVEALFDPSETALPEEGEDAPQDAEEVPTGYRLFYQKWETLWETAHVNAYVDSIRVVDNFWWANLISNTAIRMHWSILFIGLGALAVTIASLVYLFCAVGHKNGEEGITLRFFHKIPLDLFAAVLIGGGVCLGMMMAYELSYRLSSVWELVLVMLSLLVGVLLTLGLLLSFAARVKAGGWWKNTVLWHLWQWLRRIFHKLCRGIRYLWRGIPLIWKGALIWAGISIIELIFIANAYVAEFLVVGWCIEKVLLTPVLLWAMINMKRLQKGAEKISGGDLDYKIDLSPLMLWDFRRHGECLNHIGDGMQVALERQMQSERLKTELITNVSHDIKTPLTSIINYVDLLEKAEPGSEEAEEYLAVLRRQTARLKKLTEDLVEASKASSGAITVNKLPTDVGVLLEQAVGEYEGRLSQAGMETVYIPGDVPIRVNADGRLLWRVFDNLMGNVCKYALPGTRVYVDAAQTAAGVTITFKNISAAPLNISGEELMERFVRGDRSRNTEGSGLGLSIARSLVELHGGTLEIRIDGDLFKAVVTLPN